MQQVQSHGGKEKSNLVIASFVLYFPWTSRVEKINNRYDCISQNMDLAVKLAP